MARGMAPTLVWPDFVVAKLRHKHGLGTEPFEALIRGGTFTAYRSETHPWRLILEGVVEGKGYQLVWESWIVEKASWSLSRGIDIENLM